MTKQGRSILLSLLLLGISISLFSQSQFEGSYQGYITQSHGGISDRYFFSLSLSLSEDNRFSGTTLIRYEEDPAYYGIIEISGKIEGGILVLEEIEVVEEHMYSWTYWCIKTLSLQQAQSEYGQFILKGPWESGACNGTSGFIYLEKTIS